jgi:uncharacterized protein YdhG (YjbR/CyaY superfamily)
MKGKPSKTVDEYIAQHPIEVQDKLEKLRDIIKKAAPLADEKISYMMPAYKHYGALVYFGAYKTHIGFYPTASGITAFKKELSVYECSKGTIRFPFDKPLPIGLIGKIVKHRVKENLQKRMPKEKQK